MRAAAPRPMASAPRLFVNYRGYGAQRRQTRRSGAGRRRASRSTTGPRAVRDIDAARIASHGRSLGTGVAVQVAAARAGALRHAHVAASQRARRGAASLSVASRGTAAAPSASIPARRAPQLTIPALVLTGDADTIVRPHHIGASWRVAVGRAGRARGFEGFGHNDIDLHPGYAKAIPRVSSTAAL